MKILIVDDSRTVRSFVRDILVKQNHDVTMTENGAQALELIKSKEHFDVIFLDWEMPFMTGPDFLKAAEVKKLQTLVVMMTSHNSIDDIQNMLDLGVFDYMMKPFTEDILLMKLATLSDELMRYAG